MPQKKSKAEELSNITVRPSDKHRMKLANLVADMTRKAGRSVSFNAAILSLIDALPDPEAQERPSRRRPVPSRAPAESAAEAK
jgi:hypothetical protein